MAAAPSLSLWRISVLYFLVVASSCVFTPVFCGPSFAAKVCDLHAGSSDLALPAAEVVSTSAAEGLELNNNNRYNYSISVMSWNLAEKAVTDKEMKLIGAKFSDRDIVILGVQECENVKPRREEGHRSRALQALQKKQLKKTHKCIAQHVLGGIQLAVYLRIDKENEVIAELEARSSNGRTEVDSNSKKASKTKKLSSSSRNIKKPIQVAQIMDVACGIGNVITNKGGICVVLKLHAKHHLGITCAHFAAHQGKIKERNADFARIQGKFGGVIEGGYYSILLYFYAYGVLFRV